MMAGWPPDEGGGDGRPGGAGEPGAGPDAGGDDLAPPPPLRFPGGRRPPRAREELGGEDDNVIQMPGLDRIPEPSPIRHGGGGRGDGRRADDDPLDPGEDVEGDAAHPPAWQMVPAVEALLFASEVPLAEARLDELLGRPGLQAIRGAVAALAVRYGEGSGIRLVQVARGWQLRTDPRFARWVAAMRGGRPVRLSKAALETLSIVAYRQPVTKGEIDELRGVDCGGVLRMLVERGLVAVVGRRDEPGRPLLYGSTKDFLSLFGLRDLSDLPTLRDLRELQDDDPREGPLGQGRLGQQQLPMPAVDAADGDDGTTEPEGDGPQA